MSSTGLNVVFGPLFRLHVMGERVEETRFFSIQFKLGRRIDAFAPEEDIMNQCGYRIIGVIPEEGIEEKKTTGLEEALDRCSTDGVNLCQSRRAQRQS